MRRWMFLVVVMAAWLTLADTSDGVDGVLRQEFETWKWTHGKNYTDPKEEEFRRKIFVENKYIVELHNEKYAQGKSTYSMKLNQFSDLVSFTILA